MQPTNNEPNQPRDIIQALNKAQKYVESQHLFKQFISGTPLTNDISVWMADFYMQGYHEGRDTSVKGQNEPTELKTAVDSTTLRVDHAEYEEDEFDLFKVSQVKELLSAAKQFPSLQVENEVLKVGNYAIKRAMEDWQDISDSLTAELKELGESAENALIVFHICEKDDGCTTCMLKRSLSNPIIKQLLQP